MSLIGYIAQHCKNTLDSLPDVLIAFAFVWGYLAPSKYRPALTSGFHDWRYGGATAISMIQYWFEWINDYNKYDTNTEYQPKNKNDFCVQKFKTQCTCRFQWSAMLLPWTELLLCWAKVRCSSLNRYTGWCWLISTLVHTLLSPCTKNVKEQDRCSLQRRRNKWRITRGSGVTAWEKVAHFLEVSGNVVLTAEVFTACLQA